MFREIIAGITDVQKELRALGYSVRADGVPDAATINALQAIGSKIHSPKGSDATYLKAFNTDERPFVSWEVINKLGIEAGASSDEMKQLRFIFKLENKYDVLGVYEEVRAPMVGLGQFYEPTWKSIMSEPYSYAAVPKFAIIATLKLLRSNRKFHFRHFARVPFTRNVAYLYHNQGAPAAREYLLSGDLKYPEQSKLALRVFEEVDRVATA